MTDPRRIHDVFAEAVDRPSGGRAAFVAAACGNDADLVAAVDDLLAAHDRAGRFLADPSVPADLLPAAGSARVGPYALGRVLGEGGYGTVYLAEQDAPLRRTVAVKVIRPGMDSRQTIARFDLERAALARMDHPNIARVLDAGQTPAGRPYFVMEYVDGRPITDHCRDRRLSVAARLAVFRDVCAAVQHAHQKGIVHRDLKPGNVLVAEVDGRPTPKVIDFGIAKAVAGDMAGDPAVTLHLQPMGTPQYMSPEQAGDGADVDTRADVYGLGALLYELLADRPPFDPGTLRGAAAAEVRRVLTDVVPERPSRRSPGVPTELDWVVLKAIEKDRGRRYPTAEALAADVGRFLAAEPVAAGPPSARYRAGKFVRRHRRLVATVAVVVASLVGGTTAATVGLVRARAARDRAVAAEGRATDAQRQAEANAARVFSANQFVYDLVVPQDGRRQVVPVEVLDLMAARARDGLLAGHPEVLATLHLALGTAYQRLSRSDPAIVQFRAYLALQPDALPDSVNNASALHNLGSALLAERNYAESEPLFRQSLAMYRRLNGGDTIADAPALETLGIATENLDEGERLLRAAADLYRRFDAAPSERLGGALGELAQVRNLKGDRAGSDRLWAEANPLLHRPPATTRAAVAP